MPYRSSQLHRRRLSCGQKLARPRQLRRLELAPNVLLVEVLACAPAAAGGLAVGTTTPCGACVKWRYTREVGVGLTYIRTPTPY